ncbi:MAG: alpha/beta fold hydrolase [Chroococcus sp. CMT-3BRIN-NPC107]|jgi:pimeloyl-ACP methyl ester carboxylesterase|nr:alpha/beta fold hydrolase [Chroococcus sp. CMT-3BRIN-NPC107]
MFPSFLPYAVNLLQENTSIALTKSIKREQIRTPLSKNAIATAYVCQGTGTPILLLHGFDSSVLEFRALFPLLAAYNQTWAVDLLGFGFTERLLEIDYNPSTIKTHLYSFWKTLINRPVMLVGTSMGGATAIDFTITYPHAVEKLVLINSVGFSGDFPLGKLLFPPLDYLAIEYWRQRKLQALFLGSKFGNLKPGEIEAIRCAVLHLEMSNWQAAMMSFTKSGGYSDLVEKIAQINTQTLILWGELDETLPKIDAEKFNKAITHSQLIWLDCGHVPHLERAQVVANQLLNF